MDLVTITTGITVIIIAAFVACACIGIMLEYRRDDNYDFKRNLGGLMHLAQRLEQKDLSPEDGSEALADLFKEIDRDAAAVNQAALRHRYHARWFHVWAIICVLIACLVFVGGLFLDNHIQNKVNESYRAGNQHGMNVARGIWEATHGVVEKAE